MTTATRRAIEDIYELSPAQQGMFFHTLYGATEQRHLQQLSCTLEGELDAVAFERAWQHVVARHPILRTSFHAEHRDKPLQVVHRRVKPKIEQQDLSPLAESEQRECLERLLAEDLDQPFDLARPPLMRWALFRLGPSTWRFLWSRHHLLLDGWSLSLVLEEVFACYGAFREGREPVLGPRLPFRDYVLWLQKQDPAAGETFWRTALRGMGAPTRPRFDRGGRAKAEEGELYGECHVRLPEPRTAALQALAQEHRLTLNTLVQGAWAVLLSRYAESREVLFGVTVSGRPESLAGAESIVGLLIQTLPVRVDADPEARLSDWLGKLQAAQAELRHHGWVSLAQIQEWSEVPPGLPLIESVLVFENFPAVLTDPGRLPGNLEIRPHHYLGARTDYPLTLLAVPGRELEIRCVHHPQRFPRGVVDRLLEHFRATLGTMADGLDGRLASLPPDGEEIVRLQPAEATREEAERSSVTAPRTALESSLADIWCELLGLTEVDVHTPFFDLGGHSLLATRITARVRETLGVELPLRHLAESPTVAELAVVIAGLKAEEPNPAEWPEIAPDLPSLHRPFPLTDVQYAYWIGRSGAVELGGVASHRYLEMESTDLDPERFAAAWQTLVDRHAMLRAVVLPDGTQRILAQVPAYEIEVVDLRDRDPETVSAELEANRNRMSHQMLVLESWPLFEIRGFRLPGERVRLCMSFDYLIADAWSFRILLLELLELYRDREAELDPLELSFRDYVLAGVALRETEIYRRSREYWNRRLADLPAGPELPMASDPSQLAEQRFTQQRSRLEPELWQRLQRRAAQAGLGPSGVLLAAYAEILGRWSKRSRFTIVLTLFNRLPFHPQVDALVGDFTSTTLLAVEHSGEGTFESRARNLQERLWSDLDHRYVSGVEVVRELGRSRRGAPRAATPVVFTSTLGLRRRDESGMELRLPGEVVYAISQTPQVLLDHQVSEEDGALVFNWDSVAGVFPAGMLEDMFAAYERLLNELAGGAEVWQQAHTELLPPAQLALRTAVNATGAPVPEDLLHAPFGRQAVRRPRQIAVATPARTLSYEQLALAANRVGQRLRQLGARPGALVGVVMEKGWEQVVAVLGVLSSGAAYMPIEPALPQERRSYLLEHGKVEVALTQSHLLEDLQWPADVQLLTVDSEDLAAGENPPPEPVQEPGDLAYVIFTSGSTGFPKGVMIDHRGALNTVVDVNSRFKVGSADRVLALSALNFDLSVYDVFGLLATGGTIVLPEASSTREPIHWLELIERWKVTLWNSVPALMEMLVDHLEVHRKPLPESLRLILLSGDWIPLNLPDRIWALAGSDRVEVVSLGGATEASIWSILYPIGAVDPAWKSIPYGQPMVNQEFHVLNRPLEPCPDWVPGELFIGGIGLAQGYWRDAEKTSASFFCHPRTGQRLYRTGDLGRYLPDGNIEFLGREDAQVKLRGHRIELGEIEAALHQHASVRAGVVTKIGEAPRDQRLVAYVVPNQRTDDEGDAALEGELRDFLEHKLPAYMVPSVWVILEALPLTANGKVDRRRLPAPDEHDPGGERPFVAPRTMVEEVISGIFCRVLEVERVGVDDDFFELGGHSLSASQVISRVQQAFQAQLPLRTLFDFPTVAGLAANLQSEMGGVPSQELPPLEPVTRHRNMPLSLAQRRHWFLYKLNPRLSAFNIASAFRLSGTLHLSAFERSFEEVIRRHEAVRTVFTDIEGEPFQVILPRPAYRLPMVDLGGLPPAVRSDELDRLLDEERHRPFDLARGPLLHAAIIRLDAHEHLIICTMHHIVSDGWSLGILLRDLTTLYKAFSQGRPSPLKELPVQYVDYAQWQRRWLVGEVVERQLAYWRHQLGGQLPVLGLPRQRAWPAVPRFRGTVHHLVFSEELSQKLMELSRKEGVTLFVTLVAAFNALLYLYTGQPDLLVGTPSANRNHPLIEDLIGFFVNIVVLRTRLAGTMSFGQLVAAVREVAIGAFTHQDVPLEKLIEELQPRRYLSYAPLFQVMFTYQNFPLEVTDLPGLSLSPVELPQRTTNFDLSLTIAEGKEKLAGYFTYNVDLFEASTIQHLGDNFSVLLEKVVADPSQRLEDVSLVGESESQELINAFNVDL